MPPPNEKRKSVNTSPSFASKLAGEVASAEIRMPEAAKRLRMAREMGPVSKFLWPNAQAITGPFGTMAFNPELIEKEQANLGDVVTHEMAHVGQGPMAVLKSMFSPSARTKYEYEAINKEALRPGKKGDINLPVDTGPSKPIKLKPHMNRR